MLGTAGVIIVKEIVLSLIVAVVSPSLHPT